MLWQRSKFLCLASDTIRCNCKFCHTLSTERGDKQDSDFSSTSWLAGVGCNGITPSSPSTTLIMPRHSAGKEEGQLILGLLLKPLGSRERKREKACYPNFGLYFATKKNLLISKWSTGVFKSESAYK